MYWAKCKYRTKLKYITTDDLPSSLATSLPTLLASTSSIFSALLTTAAIASLSFGVRGGSLLAALHPVRSL